MLANISSARCQCTVSLKLVLFDRISTICSLRELTAMYMSHSDQNRSPSHAPTSACKEHHSSMQTTYTAKAACVSVQDEGLRFLCSKAEIIDELETTLPQWVKSGTWYPPFIHILKIHPDSTYEVSRPWGLCYFRYMCPGASVTHDYMCAVHMGRCHVGSTRPCSNLCCTCTACGTSF